MAVPVIENAFSKGEISPALWGRTDVNIFRVSAATLRNCFVNYRGGAYSRAGTALVGRSKQPAAAPPPRLIPFTFSVAQQYVLEFGDGYMRVIANGGLVLDAPKAITAATQANPVVLTVNSHGLVAGDWVAVADVAGMAQLNGNTFLVSAPVTTNTFALRDLNGATIDGTSYGIYTGGGTIARIFTLSTPYAAADLPLLKFAQSADVMSLTHPSYPPYELSRLAANNWTIAPFSTATAIGAPAAAAAISNTAPPSGQSAAGFSYVVTAVDQVTGQESIASPQADCSGADIALTAGSNTVGWSAVTGAGFYNVYKAPPAYGGAVPAGSLYGYAGTAFGTAWNDSNVIPDFSQTPPLHRNPFAPGAILYLTVTSSNTGFGSNPTVTIVTGTGSGWTGYPVIVNGALTAIVTTTGGRDYLGLDTVAISGGGGVATATLTIGPASGMNPGVVAYFQQRRVYANSNQTPDRMWFSQPGSFHNFDSRLPAVDSDAITAAPYGEQVNGIQWFVPMPGGLVTLTGKAAWQVTGQGGSSLNPQPITPSSIQAQPQAFDGTNSQVPPIRINYDILFVQALGSVVRDLSYQYYQNIYTGADLTVWNSHLFTGYSILQWAWCEEPWKVVWALRDDGSLLSLTFLKEQDIAGWARHDTNGFFLSVCAISEPPIDALYVVAQRLIDGVSINYIERMNGRVWEAVEDAWCVDCGIATKAYSTPNAFATATWSGGDGSEVIFETPATDEWNPGFIGWVIRIAGGIMTITDYETPRRIRGIWNLAPVRQQPNLPPDSGNVINAHSAIPGKWEVWQPITEVSGLDHLEGLTVTGLADGVPLAPVVVADGKIDLPNTASKVIIGLPFSAQLQSVYLDEGQPTVQGRRKNIFAVTVRVDGSAGFDVGSNQLDAGAQYPQGTHAVWSGLSSAPNLGTPYTSTGEATVNPLFTGDIRVPIRADWRKPGQVAVQQMLPLPLSVTALIPETLAGDLPEAVIADRRRAAR